MWLSSFLGHWKASPPSSRPEARRQRTALARRRVSAACRAEPYRPWLEVLEERLPPGDSLALLLSWSWPDTSPSPPAADASGADPLLGGARQWSNLTTLVADHTTSAEVGRVPFLDARREADETRSIAEDPLSQLLTASPADDLAWLGTPAPPFRPASLDVPDRGAEGTFVMATGAGQAPVGPGASAGSVEVPRPGGDALFQAALTNSAPALPAAAAAATLAGRVHARFDLAAITSGPFPSNRFTVADAGQNTGRRVNLPLPDPATRPSDYEDVQVLNTLDGFNLQPRLSIPFDGPINVNTVSSDTVFLIRLGDTLNPHDRGGQVVGINQVVWDTFSNTLHVESDELLAQHTRYALVVTDGVRDLQGRRVRASLAFRLAPLTLPFSHDPVLRGYGRELVEALVAAHRAGVPVRDVVTASVFTTQSTTSVLEKIRDQIKAATPAPADFLLGPNGERTVFARSEVTGITFRQHTMVDPPGFTNVNLALAQLNIFPGTVGQIAFGKYVSPDYEVHPGEFIPPVATRTGTPEVQVTNAIYFNLFLPSGEKPAGGWPVAVFGVANTGNKNVSPLQVAASMAAQGIATVAINPVGHGFGPLGTLTVSQTGGAPVTFSAGGRGIDQDGNGTIAANEGLRAAAPRSILFLSDGIRQTVVDLMQLVRVIEVGVDVDGDASPDLDPSRIFSFGQSLAGNYGTLFLAVEPEVKAGAFTAVGDPIANRQLDPGGRQVIGGLLNSRSPSLLNSPGITTIGGVSVNAPRFNENMPLRNDTPLPVGLADGTTHVIQSPVTNTVPGAMAIQEVLENLEWASQAGSPVAHAPHLRKAPLAGVPVKPVIYLLAKGDQSAPNPNTTAVLRAGDLADRATFYRHDLAFVEIPGLPRDPHPFLVSVGNLAWRPIVLGVQGQIAVFFATDGKTIIHPEPARFFEVPIQGPLPEGLNYIP